MDATLQMPNAEKMNSFLNQPEKELIEKILKNNGPEVEDYDRVCALINKIQDKNQGEYFRTVLHSNINKSTLFSHTYEKPYGYAGDFELISKIYSNHISSLKEDKKWDLFYQWTPATQAVRNRKYFLNQELLEQKNTVRKVLILGCGPSEDVKYYFENTIDNEIHFDLLDIDAMAILYSKNINHKYLSHLNYIQANVLKYKPEGKYDLIYASGLFDYFNDRLFSFLLGRMKDCLNDSGKIVIGNFSDDNPTRNIMEIMTEWYLYHRSEEKLISLAQEVFPANNDISVQSEATGINLFLKIQS